MVFKFSSAYSRSTCSSNCWRGIGTAVDVKVAKAGPNLLAFGLLHGRVKGHGLESTEKLDQVGSLTLPKLTVTQSVP